MTRTSLFSVALLLGSSAALADSASVIGGTQAPAGKWPDAVAVLGAQGSCTGTLIAPDVVLTAGHCADANPTQVIADTTDYNGGGGARATVRSITAYPNWETTYDVAVIVLATPITSVEPRPVGTDYTFASFSANMSVHLVGFGSTDIQGMGANSQLREVTAPVTDANCTNAAAGCQASVSPGGEFIAGGNNRDSCFGDSGGPVYLDTPRGPVVIGAVSRGVETAQNPCGGGGIYVRTDAIIDWIEQTTGKTIAKDSNAGPGEPGEEDPTGEDPTEDPTGDNGEPGGDDDGSFGEIPEVTGGCSTSGGSSGLALGALGLAFARRRRRDQKAQD